MRRGLVRRIQRQPSGVREVGDDRARARDVHDRGEEREERGGARSRLRGTQDRDERRRLEPLDEHGERRALCCAVKGGNH